MVLLGNLFHISPFTLNHLTLLFTNNTPNLSFFNSTLPVQTSNSYIQSLFTIFRRNDDNLQRSFLFLYCQPTRNYFLYNKKCSVTGCVQYGLKVRSISSTLITTVRCWRPYVNTFTSSQGSEERETSLRMKPQTRYGIDTIRKVLRKSI